MRLLIVDDDFQIREGMRYGIEWEELGIYEVDTCANGLEAMDYFREKNPEIIVADIQMPGMTGLEMVQQIRRLNEKTRIIFISAYSNFEYCRKALQMGASDYVLKPIQMKEFLDVIRKNVHAVEEENRKREQYGRAVLEKMIRELYIFHKPDMEGQQLCRYFSEDFAFMEKSNAFITILVKMDKAETTSIDQIREIGRQLSEENQEFIWLPMTNQGVGIVEGSNSRLLSIYQQNEAVQKIRIWNQKYGLEYGTISAGISESHGKNAFYEGFLQAKSALDYRFYEGNASISIYNGKKLRNEIPQSIMEYVRQKDKDTSEVNQRKDVEYFKKLEMLFCQEPVEPEVFKNYFLDCYWKMCRKNGIEDSINELRTEIDQCIFAKECVNKVIKYYNTHIWEKMAVYGMAEKNYSHTVQLAVAYIKEHFREQLTAENVAGHVGKSANYFSSIFKKETGYSFTSYVTRMRMEQAKWLLLHTNKQISEICEQVGYTDYIYFSQLFKQQFGCSASKLRKENSNNDDNV